MRTAFVTTCPLVLALLVGAMGCGRSAPPESSATERLEDALACKDGDQAACDRNVRVHRERCDSGETQGCVVLGIILQGGRQVPKDEAAAVRLFQRACDGNDANGCWYLGTCYENGRGVSRDPARARVHYDRGCNLGGDVNACVSLGQLYQYGRGGDVDLVKSQAAYDRACGMSRPGVRSSACEFANRLRARSR